jgi:hypothetical protein
VSVALVIQHAKCMPHIIFQRVAFLILPYFAHYFINGLIFERKVIEHKMCVLILYGNSVTNFSHSNNSVIYFHKFIESSYKVPFTLDRFSRSNHISHFMKNCPVGVELFHLDRWTTVMKLIYTFCNFMTVPNN